MKRKKEDSAKSNKRRKRDNIEKKTSKSRTKRRERRKKKKRKKFSSESGSESSSSSSSSTNGGTSSRNCRSDDSGSSGLKKVKKRTRNTNLKEREKLSKCIKHKKDKSLKNKDISQEEIIGPQLPCKTEASKIIAPMTKEQWEAKQNIIRRIYDESTGRYRLIKGDGEIIEEIVSREKHIEINKQATFGDGNYFQNMTKHF